MHYHNDGIESQQDGEAVFTGRQCPGCAKRWANRRVWEAETEKSGHVNRGGILITVRRHKCGGETYSPGRDVSA